MIRSTLVALLLGAAPALAADVALVIGNNSYDNARSLRGADDVADTARDFRDAGFRVFAGEDLDSAEMRDLAADFARAADGSGRIAIAVAGHFAQSEHGAWFLGTDADSPNVISAAAQGLSVGILMEIAARAPGRSMVLIGSEDRAIELGHGLKRGAAAAKVLPGVTSVRGDAGEVADFIADELLDPEARLATAVRDNRSLVGQGNLSDDAPFVGRRVSRPQPEPSAGGGRAERAAWAAALAQDSVAGYERFLRDYPQSVNAPYARGAIERMRRTNDPGLAARQTEDALRLSRDQRRVIQRNLSLLDFNTRGIDGIFGPATRTALGGWQRANGFEATTYLTRAQVDRLADQAARRSAELEAEAERRQAEKDRADRAYWQETGALDTEEGLRAYLRRYPDGLYAEAAEERLAPFDERRRGDAAAADRAAWEEATSRDNVRAYRRYLEEQPRGRFRDRAEDRIAMLRDRRDDDDDDGSSARRGEEVLNLNPIVIRMVEDRLAAMGFQPGTVDGRLDNRSRRAIRRFQSQRNIGATGYLDQQTMVQLLAMTILGNR